MTIVFRAILTAGVAVTAPASAQTPAQHCSRPTGDRIALDQALGEKLERFHKGRTIKLRALPKAEIYVLYFGASWCGPCGAFARTIKPIYESGEPKALGYEIIFVSQDKPVADIAYVKTMAMPWPYLRAGSELQPSAFAHTGGPILPDLIVVDRFGRVLCQAINASGRSAGVRQTFGQMRAARRAR